MLSSVLSAGAAMHVVDVLVLIGALMGLDKALAMVHHPHDAACVPALRMRRLPGGAFRVFRRAAA